MSCWLEVRALTVSDSDPRSWTWTTMTRSSNWPISVTERAAVMRSDALIGGGESDVTQSWSVIGGCFPLVAPTFLDSRTGTATADR